MKASLLAFTQGLQQLRYHIQTLDLEAKVLAMPLNSVLPASSEKTLEDFLSHRSNSTARRRFDYTSIVVTLYGLFEQYIEGLMRGHLAYTSSLISSYKDLPDAVRKNHIPLTTDLLNRINHQKYRNLLTAESVVENLHSCLSLATTYKINIEAFCHHTANFRSDSIESFFAQVGIEGLSKKIREHTEFVSHYIDSKQSPPPANVTSTALFEPINDLAERRNEIAHGSPSQLLSNELLIERMAFMEAYGRALYRAVRQASIPHEATHLGLNLGKPIQIHNNSIVCVEICNITVSTGDWLIAKPANEGAPFLESEILEIQVNNVSYAKIHPETKTPIAVRVGFSAKNSQTMFLISREKRSQ